MNKTVKKSKGPTKTVLFVAAGLLLLAGLVVGYILINNGYNNQSSSSKPEVATELPAPSGGVDQNAVSDNAKSQEAMLLYLIEEEKLAHDVYTVMYDLYGAQVFGNILKSEETHQGRVLTLLQARTIADPRSTELGKFANQDLQALYNKLIAQGKQSREEAFKVGVAIEEKDIADITTQLATATDADVVSTLEDLRSGSESHLRAFNRQLGQY